MDNLLIDKTSKEEKSLVVTKKIIQWGVKYEPTATTFYEKLNNLTVVEFGLVPKFKNLSKFGDLTGICDIKLYLRMLEIKMSK